jgi:hypothetical protein
VLLVVWIAAHRITIKGARAAAIVTAGAAIATAAVPGHPGLNARYYATATPSGAHERSPENRDRDFTRIDDRIEFVRGERDFHLAYFNDHTRFNFLRPGEPDRRALEFAVAWTGWWWSRGGTETLFVHAPKASALVSVDTSPAFNTTPASGDETRELELTAGWHRLHITFASPYGAPREFSAGVIRDGTRRPFDSSMVRTERADGRQRAVARGLAIIKPAADIIAVAWLSALAGLLLLRRAGQLWQSRGADAAAALALFLAGGAVEALRFAWPWTERFRNMIAGDDPMTYEGYARDILLNGILMNGGMPPGQGEPFYYQAFYPYFLAATHALFGEGFFGALFVQRLLVAVTAVIVTGIAIKLRGDRVWPLALMVSALFAYWKLAPISADLLSEALYVPLLTGWAAAMIETCRRPAITQAAWTGVLGGLAAITRSTAMLSWPLVWPGLFIQLRGVSVRGRIVSTLIAATLAVFSLIAIRNAIVAHTFAPTSTELGITLLGGNPPPPDLKLDSTRRQAFYDRLGIGGYTIEVIEYALAAPGSFAANMARKAAFALGFYEPYAPGWGYSPVYIAVWVSALLGVAAALRHNPSLKLMALMPVMIAAAQYIAVVIVYPKGERLILPTHTLLAPYAGIAAYEIWLRLTTRSR